MDRKLKIGSSLLVIGLILLVISFIAISVVPLSSFVTGTLIIIFTVPGVIIFLIGLPMTISALPHGERGILAIGIGALFCAASVFVVFTHVAWRHSDNSELDGFALLAVAFDRPRVYHIKV